MLVLCCLSSAWSISSTSQVLAPIPDAGDEGEVLLSHPLEKLELLVRYAVMQTPGLKKKGKTHIICCYTPQESKLPLFLLHEQHTRTTMPLAQAKRYWLRIGIVIRSEVLAIVDFV